MREDQAVGTAFIDHQPGVLDELGGESAGNLDRHDLIVTAVDDECRYPELFQIVTEVSFRKCSDGVIGREYSHCLERPKPRRRRAEYARPG